MLRFLLCAILTAGVLLMLLTTRRPPQEPPMCLAPVMDEFALQQFLGVTSVWTTLADVRMAVVNQDSLRRYACLLTSLSYGAEYLDSVMPAAAAGPRYRYYSDLDVALVVGLSEEGQYLKKNGTLFDAADWTDEAEQNDDVAAVCGGDTHAVVTRVAEQLSAELTSVLSAQSTVLTHYDGLVVTALLARRVGVSAIVLNPSCEFRERVVPPAKTSLQLVYPRDSPYFAKMPSRMLAMPTFKLTYYNKAFPHNPEVCRYYNVNLLNYVNAKLVD